MYQKSKKMKKHFFIIIIGALGVLAACNKTTTLPAYTPVVSKVFIADSVHHTQDSVNVGDTIYLNASGKMYDTTQSIYVYITSSYTAYGAPGVYNYGSASTPVKVSRSIGASVNGLYTWTATIMLPGATYVPDKTKLTISGSYIYQLSLSSQLGSLALIDGGIGTKTIYVR